MDRPEFAVRHIDEKTIEHIHFLAKNCFKEEFPGYGDDCVHYIVKEDDGGTGPRPASLSRALTRILEGILRNICGDKTITLTDQSCEIRYIVYDMKGGYDLDRHDDGCERTFIFFLEKDDGISDDIRFESVLDNTRVYAPGESAWSKTEGGFMEFCGKMEHYGVVKGSGKRIILTINYSL